MKLSGKPIHAYRNVYALALVVLVVIVTVVTMKSLMSRGILAPPPEYDWNTAFYPPGMNIIYKFFGVFGITSASPFLRPILIFVALVFVYLMAQHIMGKGWYCLLTVTLVILNPYFIWSGLIQRDTAAEVLFVSATIYFLLRFLDTLPSIMSCRFLGFVAGLIICMSVTCLVRVTSFAIVGVLLITSFVIVPRNRQRIVLASVIIYFTIFSLSFCYYNYRLVGSFSLSTNMGYNIFIGNHPLYLHGHPKYDIDDFFESHYLPKRDFVSSGLINSMNENQRNDFYQSIAARNIREDITALIYRIIVKTFWYWFGIEKIPNYSGGAVLDSEGGKLILSKIGLTHNLPYVLYRLLFVPGFIGAVSILLRRVPAPQVWLFYVPLIAIWMPCVLTFPDTRFRLPGEIIAVVGIVACFKAWFERIRDKQTAGGLH
jgi:hypothetical protein